MPVKKIKLLLVLILGNITYSSNSISQSDDSLLSMSLEELLKVKVETASKRSQQIDQAPSIMSVFTDSDIAQMGVTSLIDVIKHAPGIETSMAPDGNWRVSIRGARKAGIILLLIDGQPFNDFYDGQAMFDLPTALIQKVEIIRGPGSALYGTNAVAGIINVFTRQQESSARVSAGSNNSQWLSLSDNRELDDGELNLNIGLNRTDGANVVEGSDFEGATTVNSNHAVATSRNKEEYYANASYKQENYDVSLFIINRERGPWVGPSVSFRPNTTIDHTQYYLNANFHAQINPQLKLTPKLRVEGVNYKALYQDILENTLLHSNLFSDGGYTQENYDSLTLGAELQAEYQYSNDVFFLGGLSYDSLNLQSYDLSRNYQVVGFIPFSEFANYDQLEFEQKDKSRQVTAAYVQSQLDWQDISATLGVRFDDYSDFGNSLNPRLGLIYHPSQRWRGKFLYATAFRAPTFKELYDNTRIGTSGFSGNQRLKAEESETMEMGFEYENDRFIIKANLFDIKNNNVIGLYDPNGSGQRGSIENLGDVETKGIEAEIVAQVTDHIRINANYANYKADFGWADSPEFDLQRTYLQTNGESQLFNQPRVRANLSVGWSKSQWQLFVSANYGGRASHNKTTPLEGLRQLLVDEYLQFNTSLSYQFSPALQLKFAANNLGEEKNSDPTGSSDSDALGYKGLLQPDSSYLLEMTLKF